MPFERGGAMRTIRLIRLIHFHDGDELNGIPSGGPGVSPYKGVAHPSCLAHRGDLFGPFEGPGERSKS